VFDEPTLDAPSPTYLVQQRYEGDVCGADGVVRSREVHHYDLYRLKDAQEIASMVDLGESVARATSLFEWSERLGTSTPSERLDVYVRAVREGEDIVDTVITLDAGACEEEEEEDEEEDADEYDDDDVDEAYADNAARLFLLSGRGGDWCERLRSLEI
jgi:tRNA A37 threonylcarbamoyladenosine biosynthesis protein TsaE